MPKKSRRWLGKPATTNHSIMNKRHKKKGQACESYRPGSPFPFTSLVDTAVKVDGTQAIRSWLPSQSMTLGVERISPPLPRWGGRCSPGNQTRKGHISFVLPCVPTAQKVSFFVPSCPAWACNRVQSELFSARHLTSLLDSINEKVFPRTRYCLSPPFFLRLCLYFTFLRRRYLNYKSYK